MKLTKLLSIILCLILSLSLFACNDDTPDDQNTPSDTDTGTTYEVSVVDQNGDVVSGAKVYFYGTKDGEDYYGRGIEVDASGVAKDTLDTVWGVEIRLPDGYEKLDTDSEGYNATFANGTNEVTVVATKVASGDMTYSVTVVDDAGNALSGVSVQLCHNVCLEAVQTDEQGKMSVTFTPSAKVKVKLLSLPEGYEIEAIDADGYHAYFADGETEITVVVTAK